MAPAGEFCEFYSVYCFKATRVTQRAKNLVVLYWPTCCVTAPGVAIHAVVMEFDLREQRSITHDSLVSGRRAHFYHPT